MLKIQKNIFPLFFSFPHFFKKIPSQKSLFLSLTNPSRFSTLKEDFPKPEPEINPIIDKEDKEDLLIASTPKKSLVIEQDLYSYETTTVKIDLKDAENPFVYASKLGLLKLIACPISPKQLKDIKGIHYFTDKASKNYIRKILKADKKCLLVFEPETHYKNLKDLYQSVDKMLKNAYFGTSKKPKNPFSHCQSPQEIFNLNRRILIEIKQALNKIVFLINYDGSVRLKGHVPSTNLVKPHLIQKYIDPEEPFAKHDYLIPYNIYQGMVNAESFEKTGMAIKALNDKKIYPLYGVWTPTKQGFLELFSEYIDKNAKKIQQMKSAIDLGCGTGVLSLILLLRGGINKVYGVDKNMNAIRNSRLNAEILEVGDKFKTERIKLSSDKEENRRNFEKVKFPKKYDLIVSNPPWIVASYVNEKNELDNGVYDPDETLLKAAFSFAKENLAKSSSISKSGTFLLIYSDLSSKLGLQSEGRIRELCSENGLMIVEERKKNFLEIENEGSTIKEDFIDPLYKYKSESKVILYIMSRV